MGIDVCENGGEGGDAGGGEDCDCFWSNSSQAVHTMGYLSKF